MPTRPRALRPHGQGEGTAKARHDQRRRETVPWRHWYKLPIWLQIRADQLAREPLCRRCAKAGRVVPANTVNHVEPHRGNWAKFIAGPFESACAPCHSGPIQAEERAEARAAIALAERGVGRKF